MLVTLHKTGASNQSKPKYVCPRSIYYCPKERNTSHDK